VSRFLRALEKVGLVETEGREMPVESPAGPAAVEAIAVPAEPEPVAPQPVATPAGPIQEQRPLEDIYASAQVAASPFSAEKLLKILDGLAALDPASRKAAVMALDAADDNWSIDDALLDAERKMRALEGARKQLEEQARAALEEARGAIEAREQRQQEAVTRIRQQIADLEGLLEREVTRATEEKAALQDGAKAAKDACARESTRFEAEATRLRRLAEVFAPAAAPAATRR
jgi:hypothetical protein